MRARSLGDRSCGPRTGTLPVPVHERSSSRPAARPRCRRRPPAEPCGRRRRVAEDALLADRVGLLQEVLEEGRVGQGPVGDAGAGDEVVHGEGRGDESGAVGDRGAAAERGDADDMADAVRGERLRGGAGEAAVGVLGGAGGVRRDEPEDGVGAREGPVDDRGVAVRAGDHLDAFAHRLGQPRGVAHDHAQFLVAGGGRFQEQGQQVAADVPGGGSDDDHENLRVRAGSVRPSSCGAPRCCHNGNFSTGSLPETE